MADVKFPEIEVELIGGDGNAMVIMGKVNQALRRGGVSKEERDEYMNESMSGDYNHVLMTAMRWVEVN